MALSGEPDYSIVVPAYNEEGPLCTTLEALGGAMAEVRLRGEIVVCDNASTDGTAEVAHGAGARVVTEPIRQISRARNAGARAARGGGGTTIEMEGISSSVAVGAVALWNAVSRARRLAAGSFVFVRRDAFLAVGGFSEKVYASEEIWLS
jgi:glycosyltransferase involved in cell wall biosynthesis